MELWAVPEPKFDSYINFLSTSRTENHLLWVRRTSHYSDKELTHSVCTILKYFTPCGQPITCTVDSPIRAERQSHAALTVQSMRKAKHTQQRWQSNPCGKPITSSVAERRSAWELPQLQTLHPIHCRLSPESASPDNQSKPLRCQHDKKVYSSMRKHTAWASSSPVTTFIESPLRHHIYNRLTLFFLIHYNKNIYIYNHTY